ncbi:MAG: HIT family protein [Patescibacteria group bacterium]
MSKTIFTKIIEGEIPSYKIYETPHVYAFLDINPVQKGHVLVVPKLAVDAFTDLPEPFYSEVFATAKLIANAQIKAFGKSRSTLHVLGFDVPHVHVHVIPAENMSETHFGNPLKLTTEEFTSIQEQLIANL